MKCSDPRPRSSLLGGSLLTDLPARFSFEPRLSDLGWHQLEIIPGFGSETAIVDCSQTVQQNQTEVYAYHGERLKAPFTVVIDNTDVFVSKLGIYSRCRELLWGIHGFCESTLSTPSRSLNGC